MFAPVGEMVDGQAVLAIHSDEGRIAGNAVAQAGGEGAVDAPFQTEAQAVSRSQGVRHALIQLFPVIRIDFVVLVFLLDKLLHIINNLVIVFLH